MIDTKIYWLLDIRPEVLSKWPKGLPFYCGMTTRDETAMRYHAVGDLKARRRPHITRRLEQCGKDWKIQIVQVVSKGDDPCAARRRWRQMLQLNFPDCLKSSRKRVLTPRI